MVSSIRFVQNAALAFVPKKIPKFYNAILIGVAALNRKRKIFFSNPDILVLSKFQKYIFNIAQRQ